MNALELPRHSAYADGWLPKPNSLMAVRLLSAFDAAWLTSHGVPKSRLAYCRHPDRAIIESRQHARFPDPREPARLFRRPCFFAGLLLVRAINC